MKKALAEDEKMINEARLLKAAEAEGGDCALLYSDKMSRLESELQQLRKQKEHTDGEVSKLHVEVDTYKEDLSVANQTINELREENRSLKEENALLKRGKFATTSQKLSSKGKPTGGRDKEEAEYDGGENDLSSEQPVQETAQPEVRRYPSRP